MIAACPKCAARYRIAKEKLGHAGVRLRCTRCRAVFRVRAPQASAGAGDPANDVSGVGGNAPLVLVALPCEDLAKRTGEALREAGLRAAVVHDGVEAMLEIQRQLPDAVLLAATLPRMYGFQVCEVVKRNESLRSILVVLAGAVHHQGRYRRPPEELYGADAYLEEPDLPEALMPLLEERGLLSPQPAEGRDRAVGFSEPTQSAKEPTQPSAGPTVAASQVPGSALPRPQAEPSLVQSTPSPSTCGDDSLSEERAKADRLARIIVSDIVLYNEEKFAVAVRAGNVAEALAAQLDEGRSLFRGRVDERVRDETDHLTDELLRVARTRGMA